MTPLIDIGANLAHDSFDDDREDVLRRAADAGVTRMIVTGSSDDSNERAGWNSPPGTRGSCTRRRVSTRITPATTRKIAIR